MKNLPVCASLAMLCLSAAWTAAPAQQMVHALSGTVVSVTPNIKMIEVSCDDGTKTDFQWAKKAGQSIQFDKSVSDDATAVETSAATGVHVIVYFSGDGSPRTAIALRKLDDAAMKEASGTVVKLDRHEHLLTIRSSAGAEIIYHLDPRTVGDTPTGVMENFKFDFNKGQPVRVIASGEGEAATAWLITPAFQ